MFSKKISWNEAKNRWLQEHRQVTFEEIADALAEERLLDVFVHPNQKKYSHQRIFVVEVRAYVYLVPFVETDTELFLKTIIPSRKATKKYHKKT